MTKEPIVTKSPQATVAAACGFFMLMATTAQATILTFDQSSANSPAINDVLVPQAYGDNVSASTQAGFTYGVGAEGFTPNVTVSYAAEHRIWTTNYGDLSNIIYSANDPAPIEVTLTAQPGFDAELFGFDLGGWPNTDYVINAVQVFNAANIVVFNDPLAAIEGNNGHSSYLFNAPLSSSSLRIVIDAANLGTEADNIGIDNIRFGQSAILAVPVPSSIILFLALLLPGIRQRR